MTDWNIRNRSPTCQACRKAFTHQQPYHTMLSFGQGEYQRLDVCLDCWEIQYSQGARDRKGFISHWQGLYLASPPAPAEPIRKETAETLLRKLVEADRPELHAVGYILAVMLERKRLLKVRKQVQRNDHRIFIYEHRHTGDVFTVVDPGLQLDQLGEVQRKVATLLEQGMPALDSPAEPTAPETPSTEPSTTKASGAEVSTTCV